MAPASKASVNGRIVWITGGGTGIGAASAIELARAGAMVTLSGRRAGPLNDVAATIRASGGEALVVPFDVVNANAVSAAVGTIVDKFGRIDVVVNSAGNLTAERSWASITPENWTAVTRVNADGTFYCINAVLPFMRRQRDGLIINIGSRGGRFALKLTGPVSAASKRALIAMTETLNMEEAANGLRACVILPAGVNTAMLNVGGVRPPPEMIETSLQPDAIARTVRFVAEAPRDVCVNEILTSPTDNLVYARSA